MKEVQEIAQNLINEITGEVKSSEEKALLGKGAIQGVQELFVRLQKAQSEQDSQPESPAKPKKAKK